MKREYSVGESLLASFRCICYFLIFFFVPSLVNYIAQIIIELINKDLPSAEIDKIKESSGTLIIAIGYIIIIAIFALFPLVLKTNIFKIAGVNKIKPRIGIDSALLGIGMLGAFQAIVKLISLVAPDGWMEVQNAHSASILDGNLAVAIIYTVIIAPICEELVFRGLILSSLKDKAPKWAVIIGIAIIFGLIHSFPIGFIYAFSLGIVLGWLFYRTGSLVPCIIVHMLFNASNYLLFIPKNIGLYIVMAVSIPLIIYSIIDIVRKARG